MRVSHALLVIGISVAFITAQLDAMTIHQFNGYMLLMVVLFRILWGVTGSTSARFSSFLRGPTVVMAYVRTLRQPVLRHWPGHNPVGGWAVVLMLSAVLVQATTGLFSNNEDVMFDGPLNHLISTQLVHRISQFHGSWFYCVVLTLIIIHISANLIYKFIKRQNLITPMITGQAPITQAEAQAIMFAPAWRFGACLTIAALPVAALVLRLV